MRKIGFYNLFLYMVLALEFVYVIPRLGGLWRYVERSQNTTISSLPTPRVEEGTVSFEYCVVNEQTSPAKRDYVGTPMPQEVVQINTTVPEEQPTIENVVIVPVTQTEVPTAVFTETPAFKPDLGQIVQVGAYSESNYHVVFVGMGYPIEETQQILTSTILEVYGNFAEVQVDFAYAKNPILASLSGVSVAAQLSEKDSKTLIRKVREMAPADILVIVVNTDRDLGVTRLGMDGMNYIVLTGQRWDTWYAVTHEIAHGLGLNDGYNDYLEDQIPGSELFFADEMPKYLSRAIDELGYTPPVYEVGTCKGRKLFRFWPQQGNIMSSYAPQGPFPWGSNVFTPLQVVIMNNYVDSLK